MKCAVHTETDATGYCRNCGKPLCPECTREVRGALYCETCLAGMLAGPQAGAAAVPPPGSSRAGTAAALGFIPGLGAVYNGEYIKALIHVVIFASLIAAMAADISDSLRAFVIVSFVAFCFYMPMDAYRVAKARGEGAAAPPDLMTGPGRKPIGAIVLIGLGVLLLLANFGLLERDWFARAWPIGLVLLGAWLLKDRLAGR
ncbi:MAG TPA: B-box zinc finger protein [Candidatus Limnocylindrales bacterium]|nr:B-box zinc finger protein [Candidatus Limnocylindrales bacterium]